MEKKTIFVLWLAATEIVRRVVGCGCGQLSCRDTLDAQEQKREFIESCQEKDYRSKAFYISLVWLLSCANVDVADQSDELYAMHFQQGIR